MEYRLSEYSPTERKVDDREGQCNVWYNDNCKGGFYTSLQLAFLGASLRSIMVRMGPFPQHCGVMDFPPPVAEKSYNIINKLQLCSKEVAEASMQSAALEEVTLTNSSNIIISGDGTWKTRGYSSRVGVRAVIGDKTGKCIDGK
ncbi:uncharacterized protein TNCV_3002431 [Trichonephila clavipes]|nr:uncharacterized protein TNCV_3002431 [Trichonephila clavipes]